jgi:predicted AAA+ superfamily ATPase
MKRKAYNELLRWKSSETRKPLLLQGARQVGKTWLISEFGKYEFKNYIRINFERDSALELIFAESLDPQKIINDLSLYVGKKIEPESTLLFFDEIQAVPRAITSLKYFNEEAPEFFVIAAGSLLGVSIAGDTSFPVGNVSFLNLFPMDFEEFLLAAGEELIYENLQGAVTMEKFSQPIHEKVLNLMRTYMFVGGMPEVVKSWFNEKDVKKVKAIQKEILISYQHDFSKYSSNEQAIKTSELWNSIPTQLAKENKKFQYSAISKGSRASFWESTIEWLKNAGLIYLAYNVTKPELPLSGYCDRTKFKVYFVDTGLLGAMLDLRSEVLIYPNELFLKYNGAFTENFVAQSLYASAQSELFYWTSSSDAEVDFLIQIKDNIIPVEVKSGTSKTLRSLKSYVDKYNPQIQIRYSPRNFQNSGQFYNIPLYYNLINTLEKLIP